MPRHQQVTHFPTSRHFPEVDEPFETLVHLLDEHPSRIVQMSTSIDLYGRFVVKKISGPRFYFDTRDLCLYTCAVNQKALFLYHDRAPDLLVSKENISFVNDDFTSPPRRLLFYRGSDARSRQTETSSIQSPFMVFERATLRPYSRMDDEICHYDVKRELSEMGDFLRRLVDMIRHGRQSSNVLDTHTYTFGTTNVMPTITLQTGVFT